MKNNDLAMTLAEKLSERKATDVTVINIGEKSSFADFFVNATAGSDRQLAALGDYAEDVALELGLEIRSATGRTGAGWVLVDCGDIIVNIFTETMREKYALDKLWSDCETTHIA